MKKIFSLFLIFFASVNSTAEYSFDFEIDGNFDFPYAQARAEANKIIVENAYLNFYNKSYRAKSCWQEYLKNREIKLEISGSFLEKLNHSNSFYRVSFDPSKIEFSEDHSNYLDLGC